MIQVWASRWVHCTKHNSHGCSALKFSKYEFIYTPNASVHAQEEYESEADKMLKVYKV